MYYMYDYLSVLLFYLRLDWFVVPNQSTTNEPLSLQASSSMDPSFYATHPTMERLWMYTVLTGKMKDYSWPDSDVTITKPDGTEVTESTSLYGDTCTGHRGSDVFPFGLLETDTDGFEVRTNGIQPCPYVVNNLYTCILAG